MTRTEKPGKSAPRSTEYMKVTEMQEALVNPKGHAEAPIRGSIARFGFMDQPVLDERTGRLVAGHGRLAQLLAMQAEGQDPPDGITVDADGEWLWPVTRGWSSRSDDEAHIAGVTLNRLTEIGGWDDLESLTAILHAADDIDPGMLALTGYTTAELAALDAITGAGEGEGDGEDDDDVLERTDRAAWPRITAQVPPDVHERWLLIPGNDDADRVMVVLREWEARQSEAMTGVDSSGTSDAKAAS